MDDFAERMLERTRRRQELLASTSTKTTLPNPSPSPAIEIPLSSTSEPSLPPPPPPFEIHRRTRLAELASRVGLWLAEEQNNQYPLLNNDDPIVPDTPEEEVDSDVKQSNGTNVPASSSEVTATEDNLTGTNKKNKSLTIEQQKQEQQEKQLEHQHQSEEEEPQIQQPKPQIQLEQPPQWQSPNLSTTTLTVAQRRALFEKNIAAQQQNNKPVTTTTITISMTNTTPVTNLVSTSTTTAEDNNEEHVFNEPSTPPRSIPELSSPPSRRGTRPRASPAVAITAIGNLSPQKRQTWTPPCIKNVLLKKRLINELDEESEQYPDSNVTSPAVATSSPINADTVSPADRIAISVRRVQFVPPSSSSLYPDLSLIEEDNDNDKEPVKTSLENQTTGCKRRNNALSNSTVSSESISEDTTDDEITVAKRSRCELKEVDDKTTDNVPGTSYSQTSDSKPTTSNEPVSSVFSLSDEDSAPNSPLSRTCTSFVYCNKGGSSTVYNFQVGDDDSTPNEIRVYNDYFNAGLPANVEDENDKFDDNESNFIRPSPSTLVHTISTYRKQQKQLQKSDTSSNKKSCKENEHSLALQKQLNTINDNDKDEDEEDRKLKELEMVATRARNLERCVVPEQDRILEQATQALNMCEVYRQKIGHRPLNTNKFSPEYLHAERLLLIAGLRRTSAVREAQRLRVERTLLPGDIISEKSRHFKIGGKGKTLVIEGLRIPILSPMLSYGNNNKMKSSTNDEIENLTRWPGGYRFFVCAIRTTATTYRPPVTSVTRPIDAVEESLQRFSSASHVNSHNTGVGYGYIEFIIKKPYKPKCARKFTMPPEGEGGPIIINGLDDDGWKITVELYGLSLGAVGDHDHPTGSNHGKEIDGHDGTKSVLDKIWSTVTTPNKDSKKHHPSTSASIESPSGSTTVRNTAFRLLGYIVFSDGQVDRQQFTLNKVHQSLTNSSKTASNLSVEETARIHMRLLEDGEQYSDFLVENEINMIYSESKIRRILLKLPSECKRLEGFLTLFDDHELRATPIIERGEQWQRRTDIGSSVHGGTTLWRRLWFRIEIINYSKKEENNDLYNDEQLKSIRPLKTIVLRYWMYPEHAEQQREPMGIINLERCLPPLTDAVTTSDQSQKQLPVPCAPALSDLCARPNTLRLYLYHSQDIIDDMLSGDDYKDNSIDDPLLLSADTSDERREWCDTINAAVRAIGEYRKKVKVAETTQLVQKEMAKEKEQHQRLQQEQPSASTSSTTPSKSSNKKKKFYK